VLNLIKGAF